MQDLDLPHGAVAAVDGDRTVAGGAARAFRSASGSRSGEDVLLNAREERVRPRLRRTPPAPSIASISESKSRNSRPIPPHDDSRRIAALQVQQRRLDSRVPFCQPADRPLGQDAAPVLAAGVEKEEVHPHEPGQALERLQVARREIRDPEERDPLREPGRRLLAARQLVQAVLPETRAVRPAALSQRPPQARLPAMVGVGAPPRPRSQSSSRSGRNTAYWS